MDALNTFLEAIEYSPEGVIYLKEYQGNPPHSFCLIHINPEILPDGWDSLSVTIRKLHKIGLHPILSIDESTFNQYSHLFSENTYETYNTKASIDPESQFQKSKTLVYIINNLFQDLKNLIHQYQFRKLIFLSPDGGILDSNNGTLINYIKINTDSKDPFSENTEHPTLSLSKEILASEQIHRFSISITSPNHILKELFTINGRGTFIKKGSEILLSDSPFKKIDTNKIINLVESSFHRRLKDSSFLTKMDSILYESSYRGCLIFKKMDLGVLLSKFAVDEIARGEGVGKDLWEEMILRYKSLIWRGRINNPIHKWYSKQCDGFWKDNHFYFYWVGVPKEKISDIISYLQSLGDDFA
jgi:acetylglutamate kinase